MIPPPKYIQFKIPRLHIPQYLQLNEENPDDLLSPKDSVINFLLN